MQETLQGRGPSLNGSPEPKLLGGGALRGRDHHVNECRGDERKLQIESAVDATDPQSHARFSRIAVLAATVGAHHDFLHFSLLAALAARLA